MELYIITGASKGLGQAVALQALEKGHEVHALSRTKTDVSHKKLTQHQIDLINLEEAEQQFETLLSSIDPDRYSGITLINNAGMVTPIKRAGEASLDEPSAPLSAEPDCARAFESAVYKTVCFIQRQKDGCQHYFRSRQKSI